MKHLVVVLDCRFVITLDDQFKMLQERLTTSLDDMLVLHNIRGLEEVMISIQTLTDCGCSLHLQPSLSQKNNFHIRQAIKGLLLVKPTAIVQSESCARDTIRAVRFAMESCTKDISSLHVLFASSIPLADHATSRLIGLQCVSMPVPFNISLISMFADAVVPSSCSFAPCCRLHQVPTHPGYFCSLLQEFFSNLMICDTFLTEISSTSEILVKLNAAPLMMLSQENSTFPQLRILRCVDASVADESELGQTWILWPTAVCDVKSLSNFASLLRVVESRLLVAEGQFRNINQRFVLFSNGESASILCREIVPRELRRVVFNFIEARKPSFDVEKQLLSLETCTSFQYSSGISTTSMISPKPIEFRSTSRETGQHLHKPKF